MCFKACPPSVSTIITHSRVSVIFAPHHHSTTLHTAWMRPYSLLLLNCLYFFWFLAPKCIPPHRVQYMSSILSLCTGTICMLSWYLNKYVAVHNYLVSICMLFVVDNYSVLQSPVCRASELTVCSTLNCVLRFSLSYFPCYYLRRSHQGLERAAFLPLPTCQGSRPQRGTPSSESHQTC